jgi:hypothetical protein
LKVSLPSLLGTAAGAVFTAPALAVEGFFGGALPGFAAVVFFADLDAFTGAGFLVRLVPDFFAAVLLVLAFFFITLTTILLNKRRKYVQRLNNCQAGLRVA